MLKKEKDKKRKQKIICEIDAQESEMRELTKQISSLAAEKLSTFAFYSLKIYEIGKDKLE